MHTSQRYIFLYSGNLHCNVIDKSLNYPNSKFYDALSISISEYNIYLQNSHTHTDQNFSVYPKFNMFIRKKQIGFFKKAFK